jgi:fructan beta-fructosidase
MNILSCLLLLSLSARPDTVPTPQWRPVYHFTPERNWTNDPNGLIYYNGVYHLYNQQNPFWNEWGHMSWGHATSTDLLHFKHLPIAIPEVYGKDTTWRFSGCMVNDKHNTSGLCKNGGCLVAVYTLAQVDGKKQSQGLAYSNDGGNTFTNYEHNPVLDLNKQDFRDPNVRWHEDLKKWVMVVAMPAEHAVRFYSSPNLKDWTLLSEFGDDQQGFHGNAWECPSLIQLPVDGNKNNKKWVLMVSSWGPFGGPFMQYFVGNFDGKTFTNDRPGKAFQTVDWGNTFYAAIPFADQPQGKELLVGWMVPLKQPTFPWRGQFSIPRELSLRTTPEGGITLFQQPSPTIPTAPKKDLTVASQVLPLKATNNACWIKADIDPGTASESGFKLTQSGDSATRIRYIARIHELRVECIQGTEIHSLSCTAIVRNGRISLEILLDKSSLEIFVNHGEQVLSTYVFPSTSARGLSVFAQGGNIKVYNLSIYDSFPAH